MITKINEISNYYGTLKIREEDGKYYWFIEDYDDFRTPAIGKEIPQYLYEALEKYVREKR